MNLSEQEEQSFATQSGPQPEWLERLPYDKALQMQEAALESLFVGLGPERLFLLEHEPVYTVGRHPDRSGLPREKPLPAELVEIGRGGKATWHGPGQLVGYPIIDLRSRGRDLHRYLRFLEDFLIRLLDTFGLSAQRRDGLTGVWVEDRKIASIGVGVRRWITMHGFALNVCNDLTPFNEIVPCGLVGVRMTSIEAETGVAVPVQVVAARAMDFFAPALEAELPAAFESRVQDENLPKTSCG